MTPVTVDSDMSGLLYEGDSARILTLGRNGIVRIDTSEAIMNETFRVLRDKFHWEPYRLHFARIELLRFANLVTPTRAIQAAVDPDDDRILECAVEAGSRIIITRDKDLLRLRIFEGIEIMAPSDFLARGRGR